MAISQTTETALVLPQINLNSTSRDMLLKQQIIVLEALREVQTAMEHAAPNGRDYQIRPAEFMAAQKAWRERMQVIDTLYAEIERHAVRINVDA